MGNGAAKATGAMSTPFFLDFNPVCISKIKKDETTKKVAGLKMVQGLAKLVGPNQKPLVPWQQAVHWADQVKANVRTKIDISSSPTLVKTAYQDALKVALNDLQSPFAYWTAHQVLADSALDNTQKINLLEALLSKGAVEMDVLLATAPKEVCQGVFKALSHENSPHLATLIGQYASPKVAAAILGIIVKGVPQDRQEGAVLELLGQISSAKDLNKMLSHCDGQTLEKVFPMVGKSPSLLARFLKYLDSDNLNANAVYLGKGVSALDVKTCNALIKKYPTDSRELKALAVLLLCSPELQAKFAKGLTHDNFKKLMLEANFKDPDILKVLGKMLTHSGPERFNQFFEIFSENGKVKELLAQAIILDGDLQIRASKELSFTVTPGATKPGGNFMALLDSLNKVVQGDPATLGPLMAHMLYSMNDLRFKKMITYLSSKKDSRQALAHGIQYQHMDLGKRIGKQVSLKEFRVIFDEVLKLPITKEDLFTNYLFGDHKGIYSKDPLDPKNVPLEDRKNGNALFVMASQLGAKSFLTLFNSYPFLSPTAKVLAKMVADSPKFQAWVGGKEFPQKEAGKIIDTILNLKIKKRDIAAGIHGITGHMTLKKKNAILFGDNSNSGSSARTQAYLETQLGLNPFKFRRKLLNNELNPYQVMEIRKGLIFLAQTSQKNPQVLNPDHLGVVVSQNSSHKNSSGETTETSFSAKMALSFIEVGISHGKTRSQIIEDLKAYGKTIDQTIRQQYGRDKKKYQKTWEGFLRYDELVRSFAGWRGKADPKFKASYYALLGLSKQDDLKGCEFK